LSKHITKNKILFVTLIYYTGINIIGFSQKNLEKITMEVFKQKRFFNSRMVTFKDDGINFYSGNLLNSREIFIPFEEILINNYTREFRTNSLKLWIAIAAAFLFVLTSLQIIEISNKLQLILLIVFGSICIFFSIATFLSRTHILYLSTFSGFLIDFYDKNPSEEIIEKFLNTLSTKINTYLKHKFSIIDEDLSFEKHIENFNYLKERNIISQKEYEQLKEKLKNIKPDVKGFKY